MNEPKVVFKFEASFRSDVSIQFFRRYQDETCLLSSLLGFERKRYVHDMKQRIWLENKGNGEQSDLCDLNKSFRNHSIKPTIA